MGIRAVKPAFSRDLFHGHGPQIIIEIAFWCIANFAPKGRLQMTTVLDKLLFMRFPLPPPTKDPSARRFSSTPAFRQGPRSNEALEGAIQVAAPCSYNSEASVYLTDSNFLKLPDFDPYLQSPPQCQSRSARRGNVCLAALWRSSLVST